jgi:hypothetical protein
MIMNQRKVFLPAGCLLSQVGLPAESVSDVTPDAMPRLWKSVGLLREKPWLAER